MTDLPIPDRDEIRETIRKAAPGAVGIIETMNPYSAERAYASAYLAHRVVGSERPAASGYGIGVDHASLLREWLDEGIPDKAAE